MSGSKRSRNNQQPMARLHIQQQHTLVSGPIPSPEVLQGFEDVQPGAADRIITMAEKESMHRRNMENRALSGDVNNERFGMVCALLICLVALIGGFYCIVNGHPAAGTIITALPVGAIVARFIQGRRK